ncbi:MAG: response regulator [Acidobacteria bacterium]|nr:response regulator [Acidobacteriota bacterium]
MAEPTLIRTLIVDDEQPARDRLRRLLAEFPDVEIAGEAADGEEAMERIAAIRPSVVFLDIQMPGASGLEVAASLAEPRPHVVFCTAFDQHAVDAFELHAIDYLLKPVSRARLEKALDRVRQSGLPNPGLERLAVGGGSAPARFLARQGSAYRVVLAREVLAFVSEDGETKLLAAGQHYWMNPTLNDLEARLDARQFFRISRAAIVHLDAVKMVEPTVGGHGDVVLRDGSRLEVSRRRFKDLTERLSC